VNAYMDFLGSLGVNELFNSAPQKPESRTTIDDEHPI
jgi:hypothetical protein